MSLRIRGLRRRVSLVVLAALLVMPGQVFAQELRADAPKALVPLYISFAALQALDVHSTTRALDGGAREANPLMRGVAGQPAAMIAVKAGAAATTIWLTHRISRRNRVGAVVLMAAVNSGYAMLVTHNYRAGR